MLNPAPATKQNKNGFARLIKQREELRQQVKAAPVVVRPQPKRSQGSNTTFWATESVQGQLNTVFVLVL